MSYTIAILIFILITALIIFAVKTTLKIFSIIILSILIITTVSIIIIKPEIHKEFNINVIEKVLKINSDGSTSIIQTTTTRELNNK